MARVTRAHASGKRLRLCNGGREIRDTAGLLPRNILEGKSSNLIVHPEPVTRGFDSSRV